MLETWAPKLQKRACRNLFHAERRKSEKKPTSLQCKNLEPKNETRSARLIGGEGDAALLRSPNFWPRPINARLWNFDSVSKPSLCKEDSGSEKEGHEPGKTENGNTASAVGRQRRHNDDVPLCFLIIIYRGRVRSIVNYDKTYGIFFKGICQHLCS